MEVILMKTIGKLGKLGSTVTVKRGYGVYLVFTKQAVRATAKNLESLELQRAEIEKLNHEKRVRAEQDLAKLVDLSINLSRQASDDGKLYGSVRRADIVSEIALQTGLNLEPSVVNIINKIESLGQHEIELVLHPDVRTVVNIVINRGL